MTSTAIFAASTASKTRSGTAGEAITAGQAVYLDSATNTYLKADSTGGAGDLAALAAVAGIAINSAGTGQPLDILTEGNMTCNAVLAAGMIYCLSETAGGIQPSADLASGEYFSVIGLGTSTTNMYVSIYNSGVKKA
jgi:hypothetical protein